ncbi:hypothetical protein PF008_g30116 [Phytophthora fragariae]|uniref:Uncharacterized protein n=1 Tax=Phytophthora fragariae TaxID=53985 RepID=A0A6G0Q6F1_9STRA|nr:hypothetical protein PF008_g30116 [Phytophthora fragariae]
MDRMDVRDRASTKLGVQADAVFRWIRRLPRQETLTPSSASDLAAGSMTYSTNEPFANSFASFTGSFDPPK